MEVVTFGEIMIRLTPSGRYQKLCVNGIYDLSIGGSEANVAVALSGLGIKTKFITKLPNNELGREVIAELKKMDVDTSEVAFGEGRMGLYFTEIGTGQRASKVLYDRQFSTFAFAKPEDFDWDRILKKCKWFHSSGIVQSISQNAKDLLLMALKKKKSNTMFSVDLNFRSKLWNWLKNDRTKINKIMEKICYYASVIFKNESEISNVFGFKNIDIYKSSEKMFYKFPSLKVLAISNRNPISASNNIWSGKLFVKENNSIKYFKSKTYNIDCIKDRIGSGDAFAAGVIFGLLKYGKDYQKIIEFATAISALKHTVFGDFVRFSESDVLHVIETNGTANIIR